MFTRIFTVAALTMLSASAAMAGSLQNGVWTSTCAAAGDPPTISGKSPAAYNSSAKEAQAWQEKAKAYADCVSAEAKADQNAVVTGANDNIKKLSDQITTLNTQSSDALAKLKKGAK